MYGPKDKLATASNKLGVGVSVYKRNWNIPGVVERADGLSLRVDRPHPMEEISRGKLTGGGKLTGTVHHLLCRGAVMYCGTLRFFTRPISRQMLQP